MSGVASSSRTKRTRGLKTPESPDSSIEDKLLARRIKRGLAGARRMEEVERIKDEGNQRFKNGDFRGAILSYTQAVEISGPKPILMSNLAAAWLKLEMYEQAESSATQALTYDPRMIKARYRRALARKGLNHLSGAIADLKIIVAEQSDNLPAREELKVLQNMIDISSDDEDISDDEDLIWPDPDETALECYSDSDSSDCLHVGNSIPCRFYNNEGCSRGAACRYSHAPDIKSVRDNLGRNVCLYYLLGACKFGQSRCVYSHTKKYLPEHGWWHHRDQIENAKVYFAGLEENKNLRITAGREPRAISLPANRAVQIAADFQNAIDHGPNKPAKSSSNKRFVLALSLEYEYFTPPTNHLISTLRSKLIVEEVTTSAAALKFLASPDLAGVFVADPAIVKQKYSPVVTKLVEFARNGGSVVIGGYFSTFVRPTEMNNFFRKILNVPWKSGSYHRTTFAKNPNNEIVKRNPSLVSSYSMKALNVSGITPIDAIYQVTDTSHIESMVFAPEPITDHCESPAVSRRFGRGYISYIGDVNSEEGSTNTILAMLGLLDSPNTAPDSSTTDATETSKQNGIDKGKKKQVTTLDLPSAAVGKTKAVALFILVLALQNENPLSKHMFQQLNVLRTRVDVQITAITTEALRLIEKSGLVGVYIIGPKITHSSNAAVMGAVSSYIKNGGIAIVGGVDDPHFNNAAMDKIFSSLGIRWKMGPPGQPAILLNKTNSLVNGTPWLPDLCHMPQAPVVQNVHANSAVHLLVDESQEWKPLPNLKTFRTPVARTTLGKGHLGYIGDFRGEGDSTIILLGLFGLLDPKVYPPKPISKKFVIVLSFGTEGFYEKEYANFFSRLRAEYEVLHELPLDRVVDLLQVPDLRGVLIMDEDLLRPEHAYLLSKLAEYSKNGGNIVFCGHFSSGLRSFQSQSCFKDTWGFNWDISDSLQTESTVNKQHDLFKKKSLPSSLNHAKCCFLSGIKPEMALYIPQRLNIDGSHQAVVVLTPVGKGKLGFLGNTKLDKDNTEVVLAMIH